jgi:sugar phosphate isomerase/epimerase
MMRFCCLSLSFRPQFQAGLMDDLRFVDFCGQLQLDGVDLNVSSLRSLEQSHLAKIKKTCLERGLTIACVGINNDFGRPASDQETVQQQIRAGIDAAQFLGAPVVRLFGGYVHSGDTRDQVWRRTVAGLRQAADYAAKVGIVAGVQNHNHNNVTRTGDDVVRLLKDVNHPWCAHVLDTGQYLGSRGAAGARPEDTAKYDLYQSVERTAPLAVLVRAKLYRLRDGKEEWLDYHRIFRILRQVKYNGFVSLVFEGWEDMDAMHAVPIGAKFLRDQLFAQG